MRACREGWRECCEMESCVHVCMHAVQSGVYACHEGRCGRKEGWRVCVRACRNEWRACREEWCVCIVHARKSGAYVRVHAVKGGVYACVHAVKSGVYAWCMLGKVACRRAFCTSIPPPPPPPHSTHSSSCSTCACLCPCSAATTLRREAMRAAMFAPA